MPFPAFPLSSKIAVITGGGSGINLCFARLATTQGAQVLLADLELTADAEEFVKQSNRHDGTSSAVFTRCDVTKRSDLENLVAVSLETWGDVPDVWVAGAGVFEPVCLCSQ